MLPHQAQRQSPSLHESMEPLDGELFGEGPLELALGALSKSSDGLIDPSTREILDYVRAQLPSWAVNRLFPASFAGVVNLFPGLVARHRLLAHLPQYEQVALLFECAVVRCKDCALEQVLRNPREDVRRERVLDCSVEDEEEVGLCQPFPVGKRSEERTKHRISIVVHELVPRLSAKEQALGPSAEVVSYLLGKLEAIPLVLEVCDRCHSLSASIPQQLVPKP
mmetsp:Transcript_3629/g.9933  ORF Transcript_3629/g.9933 Transcript_3629/m.9933 type:complete len:223 (+) Transcript_3629:325-993(+)